MAVDDLFSLTDTPLACGGHPATVLGRDLLPFSIWHLWLLRSYESPYVDGGVIEDHDIALAALFCSQTRQEIGEILSDTDKLAACMGKLTQVWAEKGLKAQEKERAIMNLYFKDAFTIPEFWEDTGSDPVKDRMRCPVEWHLILHLIKNNICKSETEAWDYPLGRAICWKAVIGESGGARNYIDQMDREQIKAVNNGNH